MIDRKGQLAVAPPSSHPISLGRFLIFYGVVPVMFPFFFTYKYITDKVFRSSFPTTSKNLYNLVSSATEHPISKQWYFQDAKLLQNLWKLPSAQAYMDKNTQQPRLEYQVKEGYCGSATQRCILRSFGLSSETLPPQKHGESKPEEWSENTIKMAKKHSNGKIQLSSSILRAGGDVSYEEFVSTLRDGLANKNVRIACNFLRSALMGFESVRYIPTHAILAIFAGHFSPILGIIENETESDNPYVAIFDTNVKYNGTYLVPARRLYDAVGTMDLSTNKRRAIVLVEKK